MSIQDTLEQRQNVHGDFKDNAMCSQRLKHVIETSKNWANMSEVEREAVHMISSKLSRILTGNPHEPDHWHDIQGYSNLVERYLTTGTFLEDDLITKESLEQLRQTWADMAMRNGNLNTKGFTEQETVADRIARTGE
jgi:hypothetical protein